MAGDENRSCPADCKEFEDKELVDCNKECSSPAKLSSCSSTTPSCSVLVVARCCIIACIASFLAGMSLGFSSPALLELTNENLTIPVQLFDDESVLPSIFGVRVNNAASSLLIILLSPLSLRVLLCLEQCLAVSVPGLWLTTLAGKQLSNLVASHLCAAGFSFQSPFASHKVQSNSRPFSWWGGFSLELPQAGLSLLYQ